MSTLDVPFSYDFSVMSRTICPSSTHRIPFMESSRLLMLSTSWFLLVGHVSHTDTSRSPSSGSPRYWARASHAIASFFSLTEESTMNLPLNGLYMEFVVGGIVVSDTSICEEFFESTVFFKALELFFVFFAGMEVIMTLNAHKNQVSKVVQVLVFWV